MQALQIQGPFTWGQAISFTNRSAVKRDLTHIIPAAKGLKIPTIIGSCGGSGAKPHVSWVLDIVKEVLSENNLNAKVGIIYSDIEKETLIRAIDHTQTSPLPGLPPLTHKTVEESPHIVAQMGVEPIISALDSGCEIILAGRTYDASIFSALPVKLGFDPGLATHMGKILECAAIAAEPRSGSDCAFAILNQTSFTLLPLNNQRSYTVESVAAHTLYEKSNPYRLPRPGGYLDLEHTAFENCGNGSIRITGSRFVSNHPYTVKLEGARITGYRTICIAGSRDPIMIKNIDKILSHVKAQTEQHIREENWQAVIKFHIYEKNAVMGCLEPNTSAVPHEVGILIEAMASNQEIADSICSITRSTLLHYDYPGRIATAGNLAFPFSPSDIKAGPVYEFSIYHLMEIKDQSIFSVEVRSL